MSPVGGMKYQHHGGVGNDDMPLAETKQFLGLASGFIKGRGKSTTKWSFSSLGKSSNCGCWIFQKVYLYIYILFNLGIPSQSHSLHRLYIASQ